MRHIHIPALNQYLYLPEHLGECDARQYADMAKLIFQVQQKEIPYEAFRPLAIHTLLNLKQGRRHREEVGEALALLGPLTDSFFEIAKDEQGNDQLRIRHHYVNNHLPAIKTFPFRKWFGPMDLFEDVSFGQYVDGLEEYINYSQTKDLVYLRRLFAVFYLKKGEIYRPELVRSRANKEFRYVDIRHLYGFFLFFSAMQLFIMSGEIYVQGNAIDLSIIYADTGDSGRETLPGIGLQGVLHDLAESGVFGPYGETRKTNMWAILRRLYQIQKRQIEEENESKKV